MYSFDYAHIHFMACLCERAFVYLLSSLHLLDNLRGNSGLHHSWRGAGV